VFFAFFCGKKFTKNEEFFDIAMQRRKGKERHRLSGHYSSFGGLDWQRQNPLCDFASSRFCVEVLAFLWLRSG
jgi:hypothetical protein